MTEETAAGREAYIYFLKHVALMPFTPEQLLVNGRARNGSAPSRLKAANKLAIRACRKLDLFPDQATQMAQEEFWEGAARRFSRSEEYPHRNPADEALSQSAPAPYLEPLSFMGVTDDLTSDNQTR